MRLPTSLGSALHFLPSDEGAMRNRRIIALLWLFVQALRSISLGDHGKRLIVVVTLKKLLDAWSLQFCLVLQHLL